MVESRRDLGGKRWAHSRRTEITQPRTNQTMMIPSAADTTPAMRKELSGDSSALAASRFAAPGKAAKISPSMASTRPMATTKSDISTAKPRHQCGGFDVPTGIASRPLLQRQIPSHSRIIELVVSFGTDASKRAYWKGVQASEQGHYSAVRRSRSIHPLMRPKAASS